MESNILIRQQWGEIRRPTETKVAQMKKVRQLLEQGKGNAEKGREVYTNTCSACHRLGDLGNDVAPDLTGYELDNLDFLLPAVIFPNLGVREEFELVTLTLRSENENTGAVLAGFVTDASEGTLTIRDLVGNETKVSRAEVVDESRAAISLMPEGLLDALTDEQIRDLFEFLQSQRKRRQRVITGSISSLTQPEHLNVPKPCWCSSIFKGDVTFACLGESLKSTQMAFVNRSDPIVAFHVDGPDNRVSVLSAHFLAIDPVLDFIPHHA